MLDIILIHPRGIGHTDCTGDMGTPPFAGDMQTIP